MLLAHSTSDTMVPIEQFYDYGGKLGDTMPEGYKVRLRDFLTHPALTRPFADVVPDEWVEYVHSISAQSGAPVLRFDPSKMFSFNVLDEGPMEAPNSHFKYDSVSSVTDSGFFAFHLSRGAAFTNRLNIRKLDLLAERYETEPDDVLLELQICLASDHNRAVWSAYCAESKTLLAREAGSVLRG